MYTHRFYKQDDNRCRVSMRLVHSKISLTGNERIALSHLLLHLFTHSMYNINQTTNNPSKGRNCISSCIYSIMFAIFLRWARKRPIMTSKMKSHHDFSYGFSPETTVSFIEKLKETSHSRQGTNPLCPFTQSFTFLAIYSIDKHCYSMHLCPVLYQI